MTFSIRRSLFLCQSPLTPDCFVILQLLADSTVHPCRKLFLSAFLPVDRSDCFMSPKTTALKAILWNFGSPSLFSPHHSCSCVKIGFIFAVIQTSNRLKHDQPINRQVHQSSAKATRMIQQCHLYYILNMLLFRNYSSILYMWSGRGSSYQYLVYDEKINLLKWK